MRGTNITRRDIMIQLQIRIPEQLQAQVLHSLTYGIIMMKSSMISDTV